jgi:pimeloyl-ACP methyl ester carboxylesterase
MLIFPLCHQGQPGYIRQYIAVAGKKMSYESFGLETRLPGDPVLVFEAGSRGGVINFSALFPAVSKFTAGVAYDRNGEEESEQDSTVLTDGDNVRRLHALLQAVHVDPPYIVIGHSLGGSLIRLFTSLYPAEVAGLVFIDPADFMLTEKQDEEIKRISRSDMGLRDIHLRALESGARDSADSPSNRYKSQKRLNYIAHHGDLHDYGSLTPLPDIPIAVLMTCHQPKMDTSDSLALHLLAIFDAMNHIRIANYTAMIDNNQDSYVMLLPRYEHFIQRQDPALVVTVIEDIYQKALERLKRPKEK